MNGSGSVPVASFKHKCKMITALWAASSVIFALVHRSPICSFLPRESFGKAVWNNC